MRTDSYPQDAGFRIGTNSSSLTLKTVYTTDLLNSASGSFSAEVSGLDPSTTYYYQAFMTVSDGKGGYTEITSSTGSFTTSAVASVSPGYLGCYEIPTISNLSGTGTSNTNSGRDDKWFRYYTTNSKQQVATHTFTHPTTSKQTRNYTVLYDESVYAPRWVAYAMHSGTWLDDGSGRSGSWTTDPAINLIQQTGLDDAQTVGYSRGHMVSSQERQSSAGQNAQTFYYTNQAPQWQNGFNGGIWSTLEQKIAANAPSGRDTLYVVTGVLYENDTKLPSGSLSVPIPSHFYKCLMKCSFNASGTMTAASGIAYLYTNESHTSVNYYDSPFVTTIDAIEARTGYDFFPNVPSSLQTSAESTATPLWTY